MKNIFYIILLKFLICQFCFAEVTVKIIKTTGDTKVRFGLDENWQKAVPGINLKEIDTILTGEGGEIILQFESGKKFVLGNNSILDIGDLREIQEKELFLFLMSKKVDKFEPRNHKTKLRIGNISSTYGEYKTPKDSLDSADTNYSKKEINGTIALYLQKYYTNTVYKLHKLLDKYRSRIDSGEAYFYIAKAFEALGQNGRAIDSYQQVVEIYQKAEVLDSTKTEYLKKSQLALERLKVEN
jgi:tetratricopeptide (TPR) repeat protein